VAGFAFRLADPHVLVALAWLLAARAFVTFVGIPVALVVWIGTAVGVVPHRSALDDASADKPCRCGRCLGEQSQAPEA